MTESGIMISEFSTDPFLSRKPFTWNCFACIVKSLISYILRTPRDSVSYFQTR